MLILALHQLQLLHPISSLKVFQPSKIASHMTSSRNQLVAQQGCGWTFRCSFELGWLIQKWFWKDSVLCPFVKLKKYLFILLHQVLGATCGIFSCGMWDLVPWPGIEHRPPALGVWNLSHWITRGSQFCPKLSFLAEVALNTGTRRGFTLWLDLAFSNLSPGSHFSGFESIKKWHGVERPQLWSLFLFYWESLHTSIFPSLIMQSNFWGNTFRELSFLGPF